MRTFISPFCIKEKRQMLDRLQKELKILSTAILQAVLKALREREAQLLTVQAIEADISKRQKALALLEEQVGLLPASFRFSAGVDKWFSRPENFLLFSHPTFTLTEGTSLLSTTDHLCSWKAILWLVNGPKEQRSLAEAAGESAPHFLFHSQWQFLMPCPAASWLAS